MEKISDSFRVNSSIDETWKTLLDIERIAPCMPGAQLQEIDGDEFRGIVKVKVGPITAQYKGAAKLAEVDEAARRILIDASGRDTRGQGNASATITVTMREDNGGTAVDIETDLQVTGKVAQFGRGVMADVSGKILRQFVDNLERDVLNAPAPPGPESLTAPVESTAGAASASAASVSGPRKVDMPEAEAVNLLDAAGVPVLKRLAPLAILALILAAFLCRRSRRRAA